MPKIIILLFAFIFMVAAAPSGSYKTISKGYVKVPGAGNQPEFYISATEVSNAQYREFLKELESRGALDKLKYARVDTSKWRNYLAKNEEFAEVYFKNEAYDNFPVVNISHKGAQLYCEWLTEKYNATAKVKATFRLPTEKEWMYAARGGNPQATYPWKGDSLTWQERGQWKGADQCNYRHYKALALTVSKTTREILITTPVQSFWPNAYGIYNMSGNVAEYVAEDGFTKGGGWGSYADKVTITAREDFTSDEVPSPNIGFRPVMVLKK